ncbi:MAG: glucose-6-phosphate isomerase [Spirochaetes bacterium]|nr:glucose-6-phosphate isomerase [Spirochaetota bacterium]
MQNPHKYSAIDQSPLWPELSASKPEKLREVLNAQRIHERILPAGGGLSYSWAAMDLADRTVELLQAAADELGLIDQYRQVLSGQMMNRGEKRMVLHHALRGSPAGRVVVDGVDYSAFYASELARLSAFADKIRNGELRTSGGKTFTDVVQIGIGGSDLGPRALYLAVEQQARSAGLLKLQAHFISNVDPDDANAVLAGIDAERTLFILVSKSGTTQETLANEALVRSYLQQKTGLDAAKQLVAVTSQTSPLANNPSYLDSFYIDDYIGGRYSATSAVGGLVLSVALGPETFQAILDGAAEADELALNTDILKNAALLDALLGVVQRNIFMRPSTAVLPYTQALSRFPAHLQQLDMESNGKQIRRDDQPCAIASGPVVFGEPGTNGQHSFFQLLHQGTDIIPLQFIGFRENQTENDPPFEGSTARRKLNANLTAQIVAFALGKDDADPNKQFAGGRPSTLLIGDRLDGRALGALLAHYENKVMFQGFVWNLNSFDQEGVQLGKKLTQKVLAETGPGDEVLEAYGWLTGAL